MTETSPEILQIRHLGPWDLHPDCTYTEQPIQCLWYCWQVPAGDNPLSLSCSWNTRPCEAISSMRFFTCLQTTKHRGRSCKSHQGSPFNCQKGYGCFRINTRHNWDTPAICLVVCQSQTYQFDVNTVSQVSALAAAILPIMGWMRSIDHWKLRLYRTEYPLFWPLPSWQARGIRELEWRYECYCQLR